MLLSSGGKIVGNRHINVDVTMPRIIDNASAKFPATIYDTDNHLALSPDKMAGFRIRLERETTYLWSWERIYYVAVLYTPPMPDYPASKVAMSQPCPKEDTRRSSR